MDMSCHNLKINIYIYIYGISYTIILLLCFISYIFLYLILYVCIFEMIYYICVNHHPLNGFVHSIPLPRAGFTEAFRVSPEQRKVGLPGLQKRPFEGVQLVAKDV